MDLACHGYPAALLAAWASVLPSTSDDGVPCVAQKGLVCVCCHFQASLSWLTGNYMLPHPDLPPLLHAPPLMYSDKRQQNLLAWAPVHKLTYLCICLEVRLHSNLTFSHHRRLFSPMPHCLGYLLTL